MWTNAISSMLVMATLAGSAPPAFSQSTGAILVEDFESYEPGEAPSRWSWPHVSRRSLVPINPVPERDDDYFEVLEEDGRRFARAYTKDETVQIGRENGDGYDWNLNSHERLAWQWRAVQLPQGAREDRRSLNDTGAAVYVVFDCRDWLRRPCSIKYSYSSTLPVGSTHSYGPLHVLVVSTAQAGTGDWIRIERNVADDFRRFFGREAPEKPVLIILWGDSDTTHGFSDVHFDTVELLE